MNETRSRILENLGGRVTPVVMFMAIWGVESQGIKELNQMKQEGIVEVVDAFGNPSRIDGSGMYRLTLRWINKGLRID